MNKHLHIVSLAVPYPVGHGGHFDLFYKLEALQASGVLIHLHCFSDKQLPAKELNQYCASVDYYPRKKGIQSFSFKIPYIVQSRTSGQLIRRLLQDDYPILLEGVHCTALLNDSRFAGRKIALRLHNVEHIYYRKLQRTTASLFKKLYFFYESVLLKKYEAHIAIKPDVIFTVSESDQKIYRELFNAQHIEYVPVFVKNEAANIPGGTGGFCLYHGNLSVAENEMAAISLMEYGFISADIPLIIAGRNPSRRMEKSVQNVPGAKLVANPSEKDMNDLIQKAQCHVFLSFNATGVKIKLINALFNGRHCIVNHAAVEGSGLEELCHIADSEDDFRDTVADLYNKPVSAEEIDKRKRILGTLFDNKKNAESIIRRLW